MANHTHYIVKTEVFEGPLDLLLNLIEKRKLLINDISLVKITDDYIEYVKNYEEQLTLKNRSDFIFVASTLLLIKSKSILPNLELTEEEESSIQDLELRLKIYKRFKEVEPFVTNAFGKEICFFRNEPKRNEQVIFSPSPKISTNFLYQITQDILKNLPKIEIRPKAVIQKIISLEEMIGKLADRVKTSLSMSFKEFSNFSKEEKINIIVGFLAMLELVKQGAIEARQEVRHGDINLQTNKIETPKYL